MNGDQAAFREVRRAQRAGKPVPQVLPTSADPAPAQPVEQAASTDATPKAASEPAKPKKNADTRVQELLAERERERSEAARLRTELESLKRQLPDAKQAESSPVKQTRDFERFKAMPDAPKLDDFNDYQDWSVEMSAFVAGKRLEEYSQKQKQEYDQGQFHESVARMEARGSEVYSDFKAAGHEASLAGRSWPEHVKRMTLTHEQGYEVAYALAKAKDDDALYARIADPVEFGMYVGEVLARKKAPASTVPQKTKAPDPPFTLGSKPHDATDELEAAIASGDMSAFKAAKLRQRIANHR